MEKRNHCRRKLRNAGVSILYLLVLPFTMRLAYAQESATQAPAVSGQSSKQSPSEQTSTQRPLVGVKEGSLTVQAQNASLLGLLEEIARQAEIAIQLDPQVADQKTSVEFQAFPVDAAVQQLLKDFDVFYFYGVDDKPPAKLHIVWVYPKAKGRGLEPVPPEQWASTKELKEKLSSKDAPARAKAIQQLIQRLGEEAQGEVLDALRDPDDKVRTKALYEAQNSGVGLPPAKLADLAVSDQNSFVRFMALDALSGNRDTQWVVERALNDPDQYVQAKAKEILERWKGEDRASSPQSPPQTQQQIQQQQPGASNQPRQ